MTKIFPFRAWRYSEKAGPPANLVTQPYDKIPPELQESYYSASPYNVVRLVKRKDEAEGASAANVYEGAAQTLKEWTAQGILEQDAEPGFYAYFQEFRHPDSGRVFTRKGFIGLLEVEDYSAGVVHRHELTHSGPKLDRLELTRHTKAHFGQLFMLYDEPEAEIDSLLDQASLRTPLITVDDEYGVTHRVWRITEPAVVSRIQALMGSKKLLVADGHHRYETALAYARENPELCGADLVMMTFVNMHAPGLVVLATHRVFDQLAAFDAAGFLYRAGEEFEVHALNDADTLQRAMEDAPADQAAIGAVFAGDPQGYLFTEKADASSPDSAAAEQLDVVVLHKVIIERLLGVSEQDVKELRHIRYVRGFQAAVEEVRSERAQVAFLLRPVEVSQMAEISFADGVMPQKSTDFFPKLLAGLTIYRFG